MLQLLALPCVGIGLLFSVRRQSYANLAALVAALLIHQNGSLAGGWAVSQVRALSAATNGWRGVNYAGAKRCVIGKILCLAGADTCLGWLVLCLQKQLGC